MFRVTTRLVDQVVGAGSGAAATVLAAGGAFAVLTGADMSNMVDAYALRTYRVVVSTSAAITVLIFGAILLSRRTNFRRGAVVGASAAFVAILYFTWRKVAAG
jgi:hypothetical protein